MDLLKDKVALITGGSSGIGAAVAEMFAKAGAKVAILARRMEPLEAEAEKIRQAGGVCLPISGDVTSTEDCRRAVNQVVETFGRVDILVNNAGTGDFHTTTAKYTDEFWDFIIALNQTSVFKFCREVLPHMEKQGNGSIINISAIAGVYGNAGAGYSSAKAAIIALTKNIAMQYAGRGIRCNAVCPGPVATPIMDGRNDDKFDKEFMAITDRHADCSVPASTAEEQAYVITFLASDLAVTINGEAIVTDGGRCL